MKKQTDKAKIYGITYKLLQTVLYFGVAGISIAYIIFLFMGQEKRILLNVGITLLLAVFLLWQADILVRKMLYKSNNALGKRDKKHTTAVCIALVGGTFLAVSFAIMAFCNISGAFVITVAVIAILSANVAVIALALEYSVSRGIKAEERADGAIADSVEYEKEENGDETNDR